MSAEFIVTKYILLINETVVDQAESQTNLANLEDGDENPECQRLSLAYEKLSRIPHVILEELAPQIKILDISHNEFR